MLNSRGLFDLHSIREGRDGRQGITGDYTQHGDLTIYIGGTLSGAAHGVGVR